LSNCFSDFQSFTEPICRTVSSTRRQSDYSTNSPTFSGADFQANSRSIFPPVVVAECSPNLKADIVSICEAHIYAVIISLLFSD